jgi:biopolymer transport protein ExbB
MLSRAHHRLAIAAVALIAVAMLWSVANAAAEEDTSASASVAETGEAGSELPGAENAIPQKSLLAILRAGGVLMIPIIACSFTALVFFFERSIALRRGRVIPRPFVKRFLHQISEGRLARDEALSLCEENGSPVATVFAHGVRKWGRPAVEVEQAILDGGERAVNELRRYVRLFNAVATVGPLLGLLGTVFGMIRAFNDIASSDAMGRPELLATGISEALITTAAGLSIAIPALVIYMFFLSRIDRLVIELDSLGQDLVHLISAESSSPRVARSTRKEAA